MRRLLILLAIGGCACAAPPPISPSPPGLQRYGDAVDWSKATDETVSVLSEYLRIDTVNPPGNEARGADFFAALLEKEGIPSKAFEFAPGRSSLVARLNSTGPATQKPLCLLSHFDVVPAEAEQWPAGTQPLSGVVADGFVWGRGALDMKGMGTLELMTLVMLKRAQIPLNRDVLLIAVGDEEVDNLGMKQLVAEHWEELDCGVLINEGGLGLQGLFAPGQTVFPITVAEKGSLWLKLVARGEAGHGSTPVPTRAPARLVRALELLAQRPVTPQIHPSIYELLARAGAQQGGLQGFVLQHRSLVDLFAVERLLSSPPTHAAITNTCQVTGFDGRGSSANVIPSEVAAIVDCRVLPGTSPVALLAELKALVAPVPEVSLTVLFEQPASESGWDDPFFDALERHLRAGDPNVVVGPALSPGYTDSNLARPKGVRAYGLVPFAIDSELLGTIHGARERVPVKELRRGLEVLFRAVVDTAARP